MNELEKTKLLAKDLTKEFPRSPRQTLAGYVLAARTVDKCRSFLAGCAGEYHSGCPLDIMFLDFIEISYETFKEVVAKLLMKRLQPGSRLMQNNDLPLKSFVGIMTFVVKESVNCLMFSRNTWKNIFLSSSREIVPCTLFLMSMISKKSVFRSFLAFSLVFVWSIRLFYLC